MILNFSRPDLIPVVLDKKTDAALCDQVKSRFPAGWKKAVAATAVLARDQDGALITFKLKSEIA